jgi:hypothetical protein
MTDSLLWLLDLTLFFLGSATTLLIVDRLVAVSLMRMVRRDHAAKTQELGISLTSPRVPLKHLWRLTGRSSEFQDSRVVTRARLWRTLLIASLVSMLVFIGLFILVLSRLKVMMFQH